MIVVSDTSAISNLLRIGAVDILRLTFGRVLIPKAVYEEISEVEENRLALQRMGWIERRDGDSPPHLSSKMQLTLDRGEAEAIALAIELDADYLLIDEAAGRSVARELGVKIIGLVGVLLLAKNRGHIELVEPVIQELVTKARFRLSKELIDEVLYQAGER